jgi:hypothetical protein
VLRLDWAGLRRTGCPRMGSDAKIHVMASHSLSSHREYGQVVGVASSFSTRSMARSWGRLSRARNFVALFLIASG